MLIVILKLLFLFLATWLGFVNLAIVYYKNDVPPYNILIMSIGIVGFIALQFGLV